MQPSELITEVQDVPVQTLAYCDAELEEAHERVRDMLDNMHLDPPIEVLHSLVRPNGDADGIHFPLSSTAKRHEQALQQAITAHLTVRFTLVECVVRERKDGYPSDVPVESLAVRWQLLPTEDQGGQIARLFTVGAILFVAIAYVVNILYPTLLKDLLATTPALF